MAFLNALRAAGSLVNQSAPTYQPATYKAPTGTNLLEQIANAIDWQNSKGDAWNAMGKEWVLNDIARALQEKGVTDLSQVRMVDQTGPVDVSTDDAGRYFYSTGDGQINYLTPEQVQQMQASGGNTINAKYGQQLQVGNSAPVGLSGVNGGAGSGFLGRTTEGSGGTQYALIPRPDGSIGIQTYGTESSDFTTEDLAGIAGVAGFALGANALTGGFGGASGAAGDAVGSGAGFVGEGAASGIPAWDAALAGSPSWTAAGGMVGGAGATDLGGGISMGANGGITGATGASPSTLSNAGIMSSVGAGGSTPFNLGSLLKGGKMGEFSWTDLIGPGLQLVGGAMNAKAAGNAADTQLQAAREAAARFEPWRQAGAWAIGQGVNMLGKNGPEAAQAAFQADPGYQWRLQQGEQALTRNAAARGLMGSGKFLKDAMKFNQGEASQEFGNSFNRLMAAAGMGQTATNSSADYLTQGANAQAAGTVGRANAFNNAITQGLSMYDNNRLMRGLGY